MAQLNRRGRGSRRRSTLKRSQFAAPKGTGPDRSKDQFPIHDRPHAINAKARATQLYKKGRISKYMRDRIHAKANRVLRRKKSIGRKRRAGGRRRRGR